jgi:methyl-accepting chemotaxis protein
MDHHAQDSLVKSARHQAIGTHDLARATDRQAAALERIAAALEKLVDQKEKE